MAIFGIAGVLLRNTDIRHFASWFTLAAAESIVEIGSVPPGASFQVGGRVNCGPGCRLSLPPGTYQIAALLDGYEPAASSVTLTAGKQASIVLPLNPQPQTVRVLTDLAEGKVVFDGQVPASLRNGSFVLERVQPGHHSVKVMASNYEASFSFELAHARQPSVTGTVKAQNVLVLLVASLSNQSRFISSSGPWGLTVNGNAEIDAGPSGVDVKNFVTGENEFIVTQSNERHRVKENFSSPPTLTAFIRTDLNEGTLIVSTVESGVRIFVNNKEHLSRDGLLRVRTIGPVVVRVSKEGFEEPPPQIGEVRKGMQTRLDFTLKPIG